MQIIKIMEGDVSKEMEFQGSLKQMLPQMARQAREELFKDIMQSEPMNKAQPVRMCSLSSCLWHSAAT